MFNTSKTKWYHACAAVFLSFAFLAAFFCSCANMVTSDAKQDIIVLYDNDVHCAIDGYASFALCREDARKATPFVTTVSNGDFIQGKAIGAFTHGKAIVNVMNKVGYDIVTLGNHEFDYGMPRLLSLTKKLKADVVDCNLYSLKKDKNMFKPFKIERYKNRSIAYIGVTTPTALSISPHKFQDGNGQFIYGFKPDLFGSVQENINLARRKGADYVIILSHLGNAPNEAYNSVSLIQNTTGIDVVLDGHSHNVIPHDTVRDKTGKPVLLSSTGSNFNFLGLLTLKPDGKFYTKLMDADSCRKTPNRVRKAIDNEKKLLEGTFKRLVGHVDYDMDFYDQNHRQIARYKESTIGNLFTDAIRHATGSDIALINGGGIRLAIHEGDITYSDIINVFPFLNTICTGTLTGAQLLETLEAGANITPYEAGRFLQVSGMKFDIDTSQTVSLAFDEKGLFKGANGTSKRIRNLQIYDKASQTYKPVSEETTYTVASTNYLIKEKGDGGILNHVQPKAELPLTDSDCLINFIKSLPNKTIPEKYKNTENRINIK